MGHSSEQLQAAPWEMDRHAASYNQNLRPVNNSAGATESLVGEGEGVSLSPPHGRAFPARTQMHYDSSTGDLPCYGKSVPGISAGDLQPFGTLQWGWGAELVGVVPWP